ncbi:MAG: 50S ribosomal protein L24 [Patescibacteria group bacterium]
MFKFKLDDTIKITAGKDKNQTGKIIKVISAEDKVVVEGKNLYKKHVKKQGEQAGHIVSLPRPLPVASIALVCPNCQKTTRIGFDNTKEPKVRVCKKCGQVIATKTK